MIDVATEIRRLARWIDHHVDELADVLIERVRHDMPYPAVDEDPGSVELGRRSAEANLRAIAEGLGNGRLLPAQIPPGAVEQALSMAKQNISWTEILRRYTFGHAELWERVLEEIRGWKLTTDQQTLLLQVLSRYLFTYRDHLTTELTAVYQGERERFIRSREHRRIGLVDELLDGLPVSEDELGYRLNVEHVGVIAWGEQPEDAVSQLAGQLGCDMLFVPGSRRSLRAWWGGRPAVERSQLSDVRSVALERTWIAIGSPAFGVEGFVRTHREALYASRVAALDRRPVTRYDDVAVEALAFQDERRAREFAAHELGALAASDSRTATLRQTLGAFFDLGHNRAAAAARLGVHERTVGYRLQSIEQLLDRSIATDTQGLEIALRIQALLEAGES